MLDPIVEEIRRIREEHAARFNCDIDAIFEDFRKSERESGLPLVTLQPRRISEHSRNQTPPATDRAAELPDQPFVSVDGMGRSMMANSTKGAFGRSADSALKGTDLPIPNEPNETIKIHQAPDLLGGVCRLQLSRNNELQVMLLHLPCLVPAYRGLQR